MADRDLQRLQRMLECAQELGQFASDLGVSYERFVQNAIAQRAAAMDVLQIGELAGRLSEECRQRMAATVPWREIRAMRNWHAHAYSEVDTKMLWDTAVHDVPALQTQLNSAIRSMRNCLA